MARPTKYKDQFAEQARYLCEQFGATDEQIAKALGVSDATLYTWKKEHAEFLEAISQAKVVFDTKHVESSILACAQGYWYQEEIYDKDSGQIVRLWRYNKPDIKAQALWMSNRQHWRLPLPAGARGSGPAALPPGVTGNEQPPGAEDDPLGELDAAAQARLNDLAREILETRYGTTIAKHVESQEVHHGDTESTEKGQ